METYFSTFAPGLEKPVGEILQSFGQRVLIIKKFKGSILYKSSLSIDEIKKFRFVYDSFGVIEYFESIPSVETLAIAINSNGINRSEIEKFVPQKKFAYKIHAANENKTQIVPHKEMKDIKKAFENLLLGKNYYSAKEPDVEVWMISRKEGDGLFMVKLTKNNFRKLKRRELKQEIAHVLANLSNPGDTDVFLDPFAGYGTIPLQIAKFFPSQIIFAFDSDPHFKERFRVKQNSKKLKKKIIPKVQDGLNMKSIEDEFIDKIVTNPIQELSAKTTNASSFYKKMLTEFSRVLRKNGIAVILTCDKAVFESSLEEFPDFSLVEKLNILISDNESTIYKLKKSA